MAPAVENIANDGPDLPKNSNILLFDETKNELYKVRKGRFSFILVFIWFYNLKATFFVSDQ
jgi:hypothetical protein